jgi:hypothetical protein
MKFSALFLHAGAVIIFGFVLWTAIAYYTWPCSRLATDPIMSFGYTPARCINAK